MVVDSQREEGNQAAAPHSHAAQQTAGGEPHSSTRLISGDTLFKGSIGRTDLWGGSYPQIIGSIRDKLIVLPEEMVVYPGHGETTTIGAERESNPFLR